MPHRAFPLLLVACQAWLACAAGEQAPPAPDVIPQPKQVTFETGAFEIDHYCIVLVASKATRGTRRAARAIQLGIRERFGTDVPIVRIADQLEHGVTRPIWVVEPRLGRSPAKTIHHSEPLKFSGPMRHGGYFVRVDAVETVVHGADDAGSYHGAQTLLQLIRPPRKASLFRKGRGPTIPCLWIRDWPSTRIRAIPYGIQIPADPWAAEGLLSLAARYKLNALAAAALPADPTAAGHIRRLAADRHIRVLEQAPATADTPLVTPPAAWAEGGAATHYTLAARAEAAWGPPDPDPAVFHARLVLAEAQRRALAESALRKRRDEERRKRELKEREEEKAAEGETSSN